MDRNQRRPPDVEEALSSMLWTPYERTPSDSSSDEDDKLNSKLKKSKSSFDYAFPTYVPSYRKIERYDNFRFSYPYYGPIPTVQKCITEPPSYESLYNVTPVLTSITGLSGRLVHSFTDNFIAQNQPVALHHSVLPTETETALLHITSSVSGFSNNFADHGIGSDVIAIPCLEDPAAAAVAITNGTKEITREESRRSDNGDLLPAIDDNDHGMARLQPKQHHHQHHQRQRSLQATSTNTSADLAEEPRVSKPRRYSPADPFPPASLNPVVVAVTNGCVRQASDHRYDHFVGMRECGAQTSHDQCIEASLLRTTEVSGALVFAGDFSDAANYFVESVSSESGDIRNLAVDARSKSVAMRLNVPAAASTAATASKDASEVNSGCNPASTTSIFLSPLGNDSNNHHHQINNVAVSRRGLIAHGTVMGAIVPPQPSLTIQVNQGSSESCASDQARSVVNQSSGIVSVVNCFSSSVPHVNSVNNERSEVGIVPNAATAAATTTTTITGPSGGPSVSGDISNSGGLSPIRSAHLRTLERTFTSTECQTDDLNLDHTEVSPSMSGPGGMMQSQTEALITREQRRRERRERRQGRNRHPHIMPPPPPPVIRPMLPDILHSHYPPPYTALSLTNPPPPPSSLITPVISTVPIAATAVSDGRFTIPLPVIRRSPSERSGKGCCGQWFAGPPLRALIAVVALGGVACALGGAALGATGLAGPPTSHLTAALLMIGVGVILVTVSGAAWRMTAPGGPPCLGLGSTVDLGRCGRRPCSSRGAPHGLLYPEFQHRPPPPSYQASMQEYRLRLLLLDRDRQNGVVRGGSPPPTYRSHAGSLLRTPLSTTSRGGGGGGGGTSSSLGGPGSEYSLPPSYRSRNNNNNNNNNSSSSNNNTISSSSGCGGNNNSSHPPTVFGDESMESLGSNNFNTLSSSSQGNVPGHDYTTTATTTTRAIRSLPDHSASMSSHEAGVIRDDTKDRSSTEDEISPDATINRAVLETRSQNLKEKFNPRVISSDSISCINSSPSSRSQTTKTEQSSCTAAAAAGGASSYRKELVTIVTISASQGPDETQSEMEILAHL